MDQPIGSGRVLVVEDNAINLELITDILEGEGYRVATAVCGQEALDSVRAEKPALVLMDVQLPGMDGLTVTRLLKADPGTRDIPVVALTAHAMRGDEEMMYAAGCDDYIPKPIKIARFRQVLAKFVPKKPTEKA